MAEEKEIPKELLEKYSKMNELLKDDYKAQELLKEEFEKKVLESSDPKEIVAPIEVVDLEIEKELSILNEQVVSTEEAESLLAIESLINNPEVVSDGFELTSEQVDALELLKRKDLLEEQLRAKKDRNEQDLATKSYKVDGASVYNPLVNKIFETVSCPCSFFPTMEEGNLGSRVVQCIKSEYGVLSSVNPTIVHNHQIASREPVKGDKWKCTGGKKFCGNGDIEWDALYVVTVSQNMTKVSSSFLNSPTTQSFCHRPTFTLNEVVDPKSGYKKFLEQGYAGVDFTNWDKKVDGVPLFLKPEEAEAYDIWDTGGVSHSPYNDRGVIKYFPGQNYIADKLITGVSLGKTNALDKMMGSDWGYLEYASQRAKIQVSGLGGSMNISVKGKNQPRFSIEVKDESGCSILEEPLNDITLNRNDTFDLKQVFPPLLTGQTQQKYHFTLTPQAGVSYYFPEKTEEHLIRAGVVKLTVWQFAAPKFTLTASTPTEMATSSVTTAAVSVKGSENNVKENINLTHTTTVTVSSGNIYVKNSADINLDDLTTNDVGTTRKVRWSDFPSCGVGFEIDEGSDNTVIEPGMHFSGTHEVRVEVGKSHDTSTSEPCDVEEGTPSVDTFTVRSTEKLFKGMMVDGPGFTTQIAEVLSKEKIRLESKHIVQKGEILYCTHEVFGRVVEINKTHVTAENCYIIPHGMSLNFRNANPALLNGRVSFTKTGTDKIVVTTTIEDAKFGQDDVAFVLETDKFLTNKPNADDYYVTIANNPKADNFIVIDVLGKDTDYNRYDKLVTIVSGSKLGKASQIAYGDYSTSNSHYIKYTPNRSVAGEDQVTFTVSDGTNSSDMKTIFITIKK